MTSVKPRGCAGPGIRTSHSPSGSTDMTAMLMVAMIPLLSHLAPQPSVASATVTPTCPLYITAPPSSPIPNMTSELHACLADFARVKGIDLLASENALAEPDFTPDIITLVQGACLCEVTSAIEGWKLQGFCHEWSDCLKEKKQRML